MEAGVKSLFLPVLLSAASAISLKFEKYHHGLKYHGGIFYFLPPKKRPQNEMNIRGTFLCLPMQQSPEKCTDI